ncbi:hypothetical protein NKI59_34575 [Mesorhizobium sp. M0598]|uniref:hypothetical protein n=1 Tax=Mesorhizobium sp. M0598 TaxID=2956968 RepID=UPI00333B30DE
MDEVEEVTADIVILATGYENAVPGSLEPIADRLEQIDNELAVREDFSVCWDGPRERRIFRTEREPWAARARRSESYPAGLARAASSTAFWGARHARTPSILASSAVPQSRAGPTPWPKKWAAGYDSSTTDHRRGIQGMMSASAAAKAGAFSEIIVTEQALGPIGASHYSAGVHFP